MIVELTAAGRALAQRTPPGGILLLRLRLKNLPEERLHLLDEALAELMDLMEIQSSFADKRSSEP